MSNEVKRVFKSEKERFRWWFWVLGEESVFKLVDGGSYGDFWKIENEAPVFRVSGGASSRSLAEEQEAMRGNDLRDRVVVQLGGY